MDWDPQELCLLQGSFLFCGLEAPLARRLAAQGSRACFSPGQTIYGVDQFRRAIGILLSGQARVTNASGVPLNTLGPGSCFGVAALFHPVDHYVSTVTATAPVALAFYTGPQLEEMFAQFPQVARNYIAFLSERIQFLNEKIGSFTAPTARVRLARWLAAQTSPVQVKSYMALANELNVGRASLYRALDALASQGVLKRQGACITVMDPVALHRVAIQQTND